MKYEEGPLDVIISATQKYFLGLIIKISYNMYVMKKGIVIWGILFEVTAATAILINPKVVNSLLTLARDFTRILLPLQKSSGVISLKSFGNWSTNSWWSDETYFPLDNLSINSLPSFDENYLDNSSSLSTSNFFLSSSDSNDEKYLTFSHNIQGWDDLMHDLLIMLVELEKYGVVEL